MERNYEGNFKLTKKDKVCLSTCIIGLGVLVVFDLFMLLNYVTYK